MNIMNMFYYIYIYINCVFVYCNIAETHTHAGLVTLVSCSHNPTQTAYPIVNMIQVINKEARAA